MSCEYVGVGPPPDVAPVERLDEQKIYEKHTAKKCRIRWKSSSKEKQCSGFDSGKLEIGLLCPERCYWLEIVDVFSILCLMIRGVNRAQHASSLGSTGLKKSDLLRKGEAALDDT
jgi:hypothetical protein